jgi:hypothetical protein
MASIRTPAAIWAAMGFSVVACGRIGFESPGSTGGEGQAAARRGGREATGGDSRGGTATGGTSVLAGTAGMGEPSGGGAGVPLMAGMGGEAGEGGQPALAGMSGTAGAEIGGTAGDTSAGTAGHDESGGFGGTSGGGPSLDLGGTAGVSPVGGGGGWEGGDGGAGGGGSDGAGGSAGTGGWKGVGGEGGAGGTAGTLCTGATYETRDYAFCGQPLSWDAARADCETRSMRLVRLDTLAEDNWLVETAATWPEWGQQDVWYGASDLIVTGEWRWTDGELFWSNGVPVDGLYTNWSPGRPNDASGLNHCLSVKLGTGRLWFDSDCAGMAYYVCERY